MENEIQEKKLICRVKRNEDQEVRISVGPFKDKEYIDIRIFAKVDGNWKATRKGITFAKELAPELLKGLELAADGAAVSA